MGHRHREPSRGTGPRQRRRGPPLDGQDHQGPAPGIRRAARVRERGLPAPAPRGTSATRTSRATTRASASPSTAAITSTRSPGRSSPTVAASAIRTGADTSRAAGRSGPGGPPPAVASAPFSPPGPESASTAEASANPAASALRCPRRARRSRRPPPPRTLSGPKGGTPHGAGGAGRVSGMDGNMASTTCREGDPQAHPHGDSREEAREPRGTAGERVRGVRRADPPDSPHDPPCSENPLMPVDSAQDVENPATRTGDEPGRTTATPPIGPSRSHPRRAHPRQDVATAA